MENAIELKDVSFSYDENQDVIKNLSLQIPKGSYTTIIGHNGSGKSTIAKLIIGLLEPRAGKIQVLDQELNEKSVYDIRTKTGIVFQNPDNQFIGSTVADDIAFGLENRCVPQPDMQGMIEAAAAKVGMEDYLETEPTKLSGGQKQRVAIAGILAMEPDIIIFDESTSMLDPQGKKSINEQIRQLHDQKNITVVSITHDMEEVAQSEYVLVLRDGQLAFAGTPQEVFARQEELQAMKLDTPFAFKFSRKLEELGVFNHDALSQQEVVDRLCQLK